MRPHGTLGFSVEVLAFGIAGCHTVNTIATVTKQHYAHSVLSSSLKCNMQFSFCFYLFNLHFRCSSIPTHTFVHGTEQKTNERHTFFHTFQPKTKRIENIYKICCCSSSLRLHMYAVVLFYCRMALIVTSVHLLFSVWYLMHWRSVNSQ